MAELATTSGYQIALQVGQQSTWGTPVPATAVIPVERENFHKAHPQEQSPGVTGGRGTPIQQARDGLNPVDGGFTAPVRTDQLALLMSMLFPQVASTTYSMNNAGAAVDLKAFTFEIDKVAGQYKASDCRINKGVLRSSQDALDLILDTEIFGTTLAGGITLTGALSQPTGLVLQHTDLTFTIDPSGTPIVLNPTNLEISIDHALKGDVFRNSKSRLAIPHGMKMVTFKWEMDWNSNAKTMLDKWEASTAFAIRAKYDPSGATNSLQFDAANCRLQGDWPSIDAKTIDFPITFTARAFMSTFGANDEITAVINAS